MDNVITNNKPRHLLAGYELPAGVFESEFDYVGEEGDADPRFFQYKGNWYDVNEFIRIRKRSEAVGFECGVDEGSTLLEWDGVQPAGYFTAVLVRWPDDGGGRPDFESVIVGQCFN